MVITKAEIEEVFDENGRIKGWCCEKSGTYCKYRDMYCGYNYNVTKCKRKWNEECPHKVTALKSQTNS